MRHIQFSNKFELIKVIFVWNAKISREKRKNVSISQKSALKFKIVSKVARNADMYVSKSYSRADTFASTFYAVLDNQNSMAVHQNHFYTKL